MCGDDFFATRATPGGNPYLKRSQLPAWWSAGCRSAHGGNGLTHDYGLSELWFLTRLMRTAPVSREMVLNFVAQTSLGLPRSY